MNIIQERDQNNVVTASITRAGNIGGILARTTNASSVFYGYDGGGNVTNLTNNAGAQVGSYTYDAFGNTVATSGTSASENPYRFSTKEQIGGLYSYGLRFYSPGLGRWINRDPIGEAGGANLYGFVGNDPVNMVDEYGLAAMWIDTNAQSSAATRIHGMGGGGGGGGSEESQLSEFDRMMAKRMEGVNPWMDAAPLGGPMHGMGSAGAAAVPFSGTGPRVYYRPSGVPKSWVASPSNNGGGMRWTKPGTAGGTWIRVMPAKPRSPWPEQRVPYVRMQRNGRALDANGNVLATKSCPEAHIPRKGFKFNPDWFK